AYAELCAQLAAAGPGVLDLVPGPMPASELDGVLQRAVIGALAGTPLVPAASGESLLRPRDVVLVEGVRAAADPRSLAGVVPGLPDPGWLRAGPLRLLGAREVPLGDVVDRLGSLTIEP